MRDAEKTREQLIEELEELRRRDAEWIAAEKRQQVLSRVRDQVWKMKARDDIDPVLVVVRESLLELGVSFEACGVNLVDVSVDPPRWRIHEMWETSTWKEGSGTPGTRVLDRIWQRGGVVYRPDLQAEDPLCERRLVGPRARSIVDVPFSHGTLAVNSPEPNAFPAEAMAHIQALAGALSEGFHRLDDILRVEQRNRELEGEIAERRQAEEALRESEKLLRRIAENYPNSYVSIIEGDYTAGFTSGQEFRKRGIDPEQYRGVALESVFGDKTPIVRQHYEMTFEGEERSFELFMSGQYQHYRTVPLYAEDGSVPRILVVVEDITERKRDEEELARHRIDLEALVEKRTKELTLANRQLQQEIAERQKTELEIAASLKEKEVLLHELHHRVKNNLQIISSLLDLQANRIEDETALAVLQESSHRVRAIGRIHQSLYQSENWTQVDLAAYLRTLCEDLVGSYRTGGEPVSLEFQLEDVTLDIDAAIPCGLIVNELVTNATQHAFGADEKGTIGIDLRTEGSDHLALTVWDDGQGMPPEVDFHRAESLGLRLVRSLVRQIKGSIDISREGGTRLEIRFRPTAVVEG